MQFVFYYFMLFIIIFFFFYYYSVAETGLVHLNNYSEKLIQDSGECEKKSHFVIII